jgi:thioesterase-3
MSVLDIKVRGYHLDIYQHVNNARYLEFLEEARWTFFEDYPLAQKVHGLGQAFVLVNININYRRPAFVNETISIHTRVSRIGTKSCVIHQEMRLKGTDTIIGDADITFCVLDQKTHEALPIEGEIRELMESMKEL